MTHVPCTMAHVSSTKAFFCVKVSYQVQSTWMLTFHKEKAFGFSDFPRLLSFLALTLLCRGKIRHPISSSNRPKCLFVSCLWCTIIWGRAISIMCIYKNACRLLLTWKKKFGWNISAIMFFMIHSLNSRLIPYYCRVYSLDLVIKDFLWRELFYWHDER